MRTSSKLADASEVFKEYLERLEDGQDAEGFLAAHPEIARAVETYREVQNIYSPVPPGDNLSAGKERKTEAPPGADVFFASGERVGDFEIVRELGRGGMGVVYLAHQLSIDRPAALKFLSPRVTASPGGRERFLNEARVIGKLRHPNIVIVHLAAEERGRLYIAMEYVPGAGLDHIIARLRERGQRSPTGADYFECLEDALESKRAALQVPLKQRSARYPMMVAELIRQIAVALEHAHGERVIHRDVKPSNILIDEHGKARLIDFGLNFEIGSDGVTQPLQLYGSPRYLAPERLSGSRQSQRIDVYGLGVTLYEALTLRLPFKGRTNAETLELLKRGRPVLPRKLNPEVPRDLEAIAMKAIATDPVRRYQSAKDLADDIEAFFEGKPLLAKPIRWPGRLRIGFLRTLLFAFEHPVLALIILGMAGIYGAGLSLKYHAKPAPSAPIPVIARAPVARHQPVTPRRQEASDLSGDDLRHLKAVQQEYGLSITPPKGWKMESSLVDDANVRFVKENSNFAALGEMKVYFGRPPKSIDEIKDSVQNGGGDFTLIKRSKVDLSGVPAELDTFRIKDFGPSKTYLRLAFTSAGVGYEIVCVAMDDYYGEYAPAFTQFIANLKFTPPSVP